MTEHRTVTKPTIVNDSNVKKLPYLQIEKFNNIKPKPIQWLWQEHIPIGQYTLLAGLPGVGKSQFLAWLAAQVSNENSKIYINFSNYKIDTGSVIIIAGEDDKEEALYPRLKALGANMGNIYHANSLYHPTNENHFIHFNLNDHLKYLEKAILEIGNVKLLIFDPITSFLGKTKDFIDAEVREFLSKLTNLLKKHNIACVLNKHLRKQKSGADIGSAMDEVSGSSAWVAVARQVFVIAKHPEEEDIILFSNMKTNLKRKIKQAYTYKILDYSFQNEDNDLIETSYIEWQKNVIEISTDDILSKNAFIESKNGMAQKFILQYLKEYGQSLSSRIVEAAKLSNFKKNTIYRALENLEEDEKIKSQPSFSKQKMYELN